MRGRYLEQTTKQHEQPLCLTTSRHTGQLSDLRGECLQGEYEECGVEVQVVRDVEAESCSAFGTRFCSYLNAQQNR